MTFEPTSNLRGFKGHQSHACAEEPGAGDEATPQYTSIIYMSLATAQYEVIKLYRNDAYATAQRNEIELSSNVAYATAQRNEIELSSNVAYATAQSNEIELSSNVAYGTGYSTVSGDRTLQ